MEQELDQLVQAILIAYDPTPGPLYTQALEYITAVEQNSSETWRLALSLYVDLGPDGGRKHPTPVRFFALRVLDDFLENRSEPLDNESFQVLRQALVSYIQSEYLYGSAEGGGTYIRNKFAHTLTLFFLTTYLDQWPNFFGDLFTLIRPPESTSQSTFSPYVSILFFRMILEISGEVADQTIKAARTFNPARHARDARVRDTMRERDAAAINDAVLTIVADGVERMARLRKGDIPTVDKELDTAIEVVDCGMRTFASYVGWIDINLTVTPKTVPLLFNLLSDGSLPIRLATCGALTRIVAKGLKEPADKLKLIKVLSLGPVLDVLETNTRADQALRGSDIDEGEESYREGLGRLLNTLGLELNKLIEECPVEDIRVEANQLLNQALPVLLRFMADEFDDTSSTIFPFLQTVLTSYKRARKSSSEPLDDEKRAFLASLLQVVLKKLKWDEESNPESMDDDDEVAFENLRKDLRTIMDAAFVIEPGLVSESLGNLALSTLNAYRSGVQVKWNDAELAVYIVFIFGEINRTGTKGRAAFCQTPVEIAKEKRKETDYSAYPLTRHGEMLYAMVQSGISDFPNQTVVSQFFETVTRYNDFFKVRKDCILPALQAMVGPRGLHNSSSKLCSRVFYLFQRFIKEDRNEISVELAGTLIEAVRDLLVIQVELPELESPEQDLLEEAIKNPGIFDAQLYLFEAVGTLVSLFYKSPEQRASLLSSIVNPLLDELSRNLLSAKGSKEVIPILRVHHIIMALGNISKGFPDYPSPVPEGYILPPVDIFTQISQAILVCLEALNTYRAVRDATRSAFTRILATTGPNITHLVPPLMANLLAHFEPSELIDFMNFIGLLVHRLQQDLFDVLDELIGPLNAHIGGLLSQPISGTDDQIMHGDMKRAYLSLLNAVMASQLHGIFTSERNNSQLQALLASMQRLAEDVSDPPSQRAAFQFFTRCVATWLEPIAPPNDAANGQSQSLPGFERFVYECLIPAAFTVLSSSQFNVKDGQMLVVLHEICNFLQAVSKLRRQEAFEFFTTVFLPAQGWPPEAAQEFASKLRDLDSKSFKKYLADFVRASRS